MVRPAEVVSRPGAHARQVAIDVAACVALYVPAAHITQVTALVMPEFKLYVPVKYEKTIINGERYIEGKRQHKKI